MRFIHTLPGLLLITWLQDLSAQTPAPCTASGSASATLVARAMAAHQLRDDVRTLKVKVVIGALPTVEGGLIRTVLPSKVQADIDDANAVFAHSNTGIQFQLCGTMEVEEDGTLYNGNPMNAASVQSHRHAGYITIFYMNELPGFLGGTWLGDLVFVTPGAKRYTLAHEFGHLLGLLHTHGWDVEPELVDGSNCIVGGDHICDTPADPDLSQPGLVVQPCAYAGTITDANGALYTPLLNNLMSYSPCNADSLTPQQGQLMRYMVDEVLLHLRRTTAPITITPFAPHQCANAPDITLSAAPGPGHFSGELVEGDVLHNAPNTPGEYHVTYVPTAPPEGPTVFVDQFLVPAVSQPSAHFAHATDSAWQSFQAEVDGTFDHLDVLARAAQPTLLRLRLYAGSGVAGALLADLTTTTGTDTSWAAFTFGNGLACTPGATYTALITAGSSFDLFEPVGASYANGSSSLGMPDLEFRQWVLAEPPCQETTRHYALFQIAARPILNLPDAYCHSDERPVHFIVDTLHLAASDILLDGSPAPLFVPAALPTGEHLAQHRYTLDGCTDTLDQHFIVAPPPDFALPDLPFPLCDDTPEFVLTAEPAGGFFRIAGVRDSLLVPATLGVGAHAVDYVYTTGPDTLSFIDQFCCYTGRAAYIDLAPDSVLWQSFVADQSGELVNVQVGIVTNNIVRTFAVSIHEGIGPDGTTLWADTRTTFDGYNGLFNNSGLQLTAGTTYTYALRYQPDATPDPRPLVFHFPGDNYPNGGGALPGVADGMDHYFREVVEQTFGCADSTTFTLTVEVCTGMDENVLGGVRVGPVPCTDALALRTGDEAVSYALHAADGRLLLTGRAAADARVDLDVRTLPAGLHVLLLWNNTGRSVQHKVVKVE